MRKKANEKSFIYRNSLTIVFLILTIVFISGQFITGKNQYDEFLTEHNARSVTYNEYLRSGHFIESTFENWESEFLQMGLFVVFTIFLRQKGSSESKEIGKPHESERQPKKHADAPWPVKKGGWVLSLYKHSLSIVLFLLFILSFILHWYGSMKDYNVGQVLENKPTSTAWEYLGTSKFWFESFQNWQSEFLSVMLLIFLSIYLRQIGSPQSKPVDAPHSETD